MNKNNDPYLKIWTLDTSKSSDFIDIVDRSKEDSIENEITNYIRDSLYFVVINVPNKSTRQNLEAHMIGTVSNCDECHASNNWFGKWSPVVKIKNSGLWLLQHLYGNQLTEDELKFIENNIIK